ncbi:hydantoinase/oxoprolinase family protein [Ramlibacter henchirensis]|uniref:Hydantoinase/oxoprolinase family protein n=1 Tax=Ramlibacter henchirensis TaxID=204072 RepID=A0A4Z0BW34_9BURK|nr:hydantoinase/oxoprolinase family protein [Ramlibacter henchirensis]TFZ02570.1 hydantoinase/oxoprolinase family protein [Ramlibacter henchirensis]
MSSHPYRLGCDIGGTFTDFVLVNDDTGELHVHKCLTTPADPSEAVEQGVLALAARIPDLPGRLREVVHGTTLVINAIIERKGSRTGLITTRGFRDTLELGREKRYDTYDIFAEMAPPLVERPFRLELDERIAADGRVLQPLDAQQVRDVLAQMRSMGVESLAVCLINSFENPAHELQVKAILEREAPELAVSISYDVLPQIREYERTSTTVANAYVKPLTARYLARLKQRLEALGFGGQIYMMLSSGGITSVEAARQSPVRVIESGPTAAVISAEHFGRMLGMQELFAYDMGGTTAKSCLIQKGRAGKVTTFEVGRVHRFKKGSGIPIQVPVVDLMEIGAGGGSIARVNKLGLLQVGPDSASALPGPASYGRGGTEPTVSDADLVLGYLDPDYFLGGELKLQRELAEKAIRERIAQPLGLDLTQAAWGIHDVINETMAAAAKTHIAEKGGNPRQVTVAAFGGAGPVHACSLARKLKASRVLVPPVAGVGSALGFFTAPVAYEVVRTRKMNLKDARLDEVEALFREMEASGREVVAPLGGVDVAVERSIDMRLAGQGCELSVALPAGDLGRMSREDVRKLFDDAYVALYGRTYPEVPAELVTFNTVVRLPMRPLQLPLVAPSRHGAEGAVKGARKAYSPQAGDYVRHVVYDRYKLGAGDTLRGPAIIEERESTTIVGEGAQVTVNGQGFLFIELEAA